MRQTTTPKERMLEVINALGISANEFEKRCGLGSGFVARLTRNITRRSRQKIKETFPEINMEYVSMNSGKPFEEPEGTMPTMKERILQFCKVMEISEKEFCRRAGLSTAFVSNMSDNIRKKSLERIFDEYPQLNAEWLQFGKGRMLGQIKINKSEEKTSKRIREVIKYLGLTNTLFEKETGVSLANINNADNITKKQVDKIISRYPHINPMWLMYGHGEMIGDTHNAIFVPFVTQRSHSTYIGNLDNDEYLSSLEAIPTREGTIAFEVAGDAMDDNSYYGYKNGDIIICKESEELSKTSDYVVILIDGVFLRRVKQRKDGLVLSALKRGYPDITIGNDEALKVFEVLYRISSQKR